MKRLSRVVLVVVLFVLAAVPLMAAASRPNIPDISQMVPFSAEANYMSLPGYIAWQTGIMQPLPLGRHFMGYEVKASGPQTTNFCVVNGLEYILDEKGLSPVRDHPDLAGALEKALAQKGIELWSPWSELTPDSRLVSGGQIHFRQLNKDGELARDVVIPPGYTYYGTKQQFIQAERDAGTTDLNFPNFGMIAKAMGAHYATWVFWRVIPAPNGGQEVLQLAVTVADLSEFDPTKPDTLKKATFSKDHLLIQEPGEIQALAEQIVQATFK